MQDSMRLSVAPGKSDEYAIGNAWRRGVEHVGGDPNRMKRKLAFLILELKSHDSSVGRWARAMHCAVRERDACGDGRENISVACGVCPQCKAIPGVLGTRSRECWCFKERSLMIGTAERGEIQQDDGAILAGCDDQFLVFMLEEDRRYIFKAGHATVGGVPV